MSGELATILLSFEPNSPDVEKRCDYDSKARSFVSQLSNISASQWLKGADTEQDPLVVGTHQSMKLDSADTTGT